MLYVRGELLPEDEWAVAIVGTRKATPYGRQAAEHFATDLARQRITVVSGLARGIDAVAHRSALNAGGRTIAVLACGLDIVYPPEHAKLAQEISAARRPGFATTRWARSRAASTSRGATASSAPLAWVC